MDNNDRKLLIALLVIFVVLFVVLGLIGMAVRKLMEIQGNRLDREMGKPARAGVVYDAASFKKLAGEKNRRIYFKESLVPFGLAFLGLLVFLIGNAITKEWDADLLGRFGTLFYRFDWNNPDNFHEFFGINIVCRFPPLVEDAHGGLPYVDPSYWLAYTVVPIWAIALVYYLVVSLGFLSRLLRMNKRASTIYDHKLEDFNYYDAFALKGNPAKKKEADESSPSKE